MIPVEMRLKNLGPFKNLKVRMVDHSFCLLQGENRDEVGMDSNGAGKSFFFDAFYWILTGLIARIDGKITEEIIRWGCNKGIGKLIMDDEGTHYYIERMRAKKGLKSLRFGIVGDKASERRLTGKTDTVTQENIYNWLEADAESITMMIYYGQGAAAILVDRGPTERVKALGTLFPQITEFERARNQAMDKRRLITKEIEELQVRVSAHQESAEEKDIDELRQKEGEWEDKINAIEVEIIGIRKQLDEAKGLLSREETEWALAQAKETLELHSKSEERYNEAKEKLPALQELYEQALSDAQQEFIELKDLAQQKVSLMEIPVADEEGVEYISYLKKSISDLWEIMDMEGDCPVCRRSIDEECKESISLNLTAMEQEYEYLNGEYQDALSQRQCELQSYDDVYNEVQSLYGDLNDRLLSLNTEFTATESLVVNYEEWLEKGGEKEVEKNRVRIKELKVTLEEVTFRDEEAIEVLEVQIEEMGEEIKEGNIELGSIVAQIDLLMQEQAKIEDLKDKEKKLRFKHKVYDFLEHAFNELRLVVIDNAIPQFQNRTNYYLSELGLNKRVRFETQVELKQREDQYKDRFEIFVSPGPGFEEVRWEMYSGGEKRRLSLALFSAMNDLAKSRATKPIGFSMFDEITESLDKTGQTYILELLKMQYDQGKRIWTISHLDQVKDSFSERITFIKEGGISRLEVN